MCRAARNFGSLLYLASSNGEPPASGISPSELVGQTERSAVECKASLVMASKYLSGWKPPLSRGRGKVGAAQIRVSVFHSRAPVFRDAVLNSAASGPANLRVIRGTLFREIRWLDDPLGELEIANRQTTGRVHQDSVPCISKAGPDRCHIIGFEGVTVS